MADKAMQSALTNALRQVLSRAQIRTDYPMSRCTTLRLGGPADVLVTPASPQEIAACFSAAAAFGAPVTVVGNGSNLLVRDGGLRGLVILIGEAMSRVSEPVPADDGRFLLTAQAGASLQKLCNAAADASLSGLEFAYGIPGTVGGAVFMNAGAYGGEIKDVAQSADLCGQDGAMFSLTAEQLSFGYRHSVLMDMNPSPIVTALTVALVPGDEDVIRTAMREFSARRREKQPVQLPSCGSTFKRPAGHFAGGLIEQCGLKGFRVGGCSVSTLHAGFLVNDGNGSAADFLGLMDAVREKVFAATGVMLEPEVRILGND